ncbi:MAG: NADH-quinone oxidoreductase subunit N [Porticoccaceae bacterium]
MNAIQFDATQLGALLPSIVLSATIVTVMLGIAVRRCHRVTATLSMLGAALALVCVMPIWLGGAEPVVVTPLLTIDAQSGFYMLLVLAAVLGVLALCHAYFAGCAGDREEIYLLILLGGLGGLTLAGASHAATLFIGIELLSLPMVAGVAYAIHDRRALEGGVKYLALSAGASATLLFGLALIYADIGRLDLGALATALAGASADTPLVLTGGAMLLAGLAFKLSLVPFHQWTPDVYEAAPAPVAAYLATVVKVGVFAVVLRLLHAGGGTAAPQFVNALVVLALASILVGSVLALRQDNLKRLLAYSSIAHFGFLLIILVVPGAGTSAVAAIYLLTYVVTALGVFGAVALASSPAGDRDRELLGDYRGLFQRRPWVVAALTLMLLSLAGIPVTAGFIGKFSVLALAVASGQWLLVGGLLLGSAIGLFYYLRVIGALYAAPPAGSPTPVATGTAVAARWSAGAVMVLLAVLLTLAIGIYPEPLLQLLHP